MPWDISLLHAPALRPMLAGVVPVVLAAWVVVDAWKTQAVRRWIGLAVLVPLLGGLAIAIGRKTLPLDVYLQLPRRELWGAIALAIALLAGMKVQAIERSSVFPPRPAYRARGQEVSARAMRTFAAISAAVSIIAIIHRDHRLVHSINASRHRNRCDAALYVRRCIGRHMGIVSPLARWIDMPWPWIALATVELLAVAIAYSFITPNHINPTAPSESDMAFVDSLPPAWMGSPRRSIT